MVTVPPLASAGGETLHQPADAQEQPVLQRAKWSIINVNADGDAADEDDDLDSDVMHVRFRATTPPFDAPHSGGPKKLAVVGSVPQLGDWHLDGSVPLRVVRVEGEFLD